MSYLVTECGLSYAVVLDSRGRFLKVPNLGYEVGQTLDHVVLPEPRSRSAGKRLARWGAIAACLCVVVLGGGGFWQAPVGTVRMRINPEVQMRVNRFDRVVGLEGLNADGEDLIRGCRSYGRGMAAVSDELADRAVELGYLRDGGRIILTVESGREDWRTAAEELLLLELDVHLGHRVTVTTADDPAAPEGPSSPAAAEEASKSPAVIVIQPEQVEPEDDDDEYDDGLRDDDGDDDEYDDGLRDDDDDDDDHDDGLRDDDSDDDGDDSEDDRNDAAADVDEDDDEHDVDDADDDEDDAEDDADDEDSEDDNEDDDD